MDAGSWAGIGLVALTVLVAVLLLVVHIRLGIRESIQDAVDEITTVLRAELLVDEDRVDHDPARRPLWRVEQMWLKPSPYARERAIWCVALRVSLDGAERARRRLGAIPPRHIVRTVLFEFDRREPLWVIRSQAAATAASYHEAFTAFLWGRSFTLPRGLERLMQGES